MFLSSAALFLGDAGCTKKDDVNAAEDMNLPTGCGMPGEKGNALGVGRFCSPGKGQCQENSFAIFCTVDFVPAAAPYCTSACRKDQDCGEGAFCSGSGMGSRGCVPAICGGTPSQAADMSASPADAGADLASSDAAHSG